MLKFESKKAEQVFCFFAKVGTCKDNTYIKIIQKHPFSAMTVQNSTSERCGDGSVHMPQITRTSVEVPKMVQRIFQVMHCLLDQENAKLHAATTVWIYREKVRVVNWLSVQ